jgi:hypothetical protein
MITMFREGGFGMFLILAVAAATAALAATRPRGKQRDVLFGGAIASLAAGLLGIATGMQAVAANFRRFADPLEALSVGMRELSYNGVFAAAVAAALIAASAVVGRQEAASASDKS